MDLRKLYVKYLDFEQETDNALGVSEFGFRRMSLEEFEKYLESLDPVNWELASIKWNLGRSSWLKSDEYHASAPDIRADWTLSDAEKLRIADRILGKDRPKKAA